MGNTFVRMPWTEPLHIIIGDYEYIIYIYAIVLGFPHPFPTLLPAAPPTSSWCLLPTAVSPLPLPHHMYYITPFPTSLTSVPSFLLMIPFLVSWPSHIFKHTRTCICNFKPRSCIRENAFVFLSLAYFTWYNDFSVAPCFVISLFFMAA